MPFLLNSQIINYKFTRFMPPTIVTFETMAAAVASISPLNSASMSLPLEKQDAFTHSIPIATALRVRRMSGKAPQR